MLGDLLASCFDVNLALWAGAASEVEEQAVRWVSEFIGFPAAAGAFTSGGTISNVTALAAARERALPGSRRCGMAGRAGALYCSREAHYSVVRAAELLGIGSDLVRALPQDAERRVLPEEVAHAIDRDVAAGVAPIAVVATAGTTLTGAVDPIDALADVCAESGTWLHVDGAYGVAAASTPSAGHLFAGLERADSVTLDAHKWLFLPKACGVVLVRRREDLHGALAHEEDYVPHDRPDHHMVDITLEYSRPFRALKLWLAFRAHGADAIRDAIERNLRQARLAARRGRGVRRLRAPLRRAAPLGRAVPSRSRGRHRPRRAQPPARRRPPGDGRRLGRARTGRRGRLPAAVRRELPNDGRRRTRARHACARRGADAGRAPQRPSASSSRSCRSCGRRRRGAARPASCSRACRRRRAPSCAAAAGSSPRASGSPRRPPPCTRVVRPA